MVSNTSVKNNFLTFFFELTYMLKKIYIAVFERRIKLSSSIKYSNPPIQEVVCELVFGENTEWDPTIYGRLFERLQERFPKRKRKIEQTISVQKGEKGFSHKIHTPENAIFETEDGKKAVEIGDKRISFHQLSPYPTWEELKPLITEIYSKLYDLTQIEDFKQQRLTYDNIIEIPEVHFNIEDYFDFYPFLGERLPQEQERFFVGCIFPEKNNYSRIELIPVNSEKEDISAFRLTLSYYNNIYHHDCSSQEVSDWLEEAHNKIQELFEGSIKDSLREIFGR